MTPPEISQLCLSLATLIAAVTALFNSLKNSRKIEQVHQLTNGLNQKLVEGAGREGYTAGVTDQKAGTAPNQ